MIQKLLYRKQASAYPRKTADIGRPIGYSLMTPAGLYPILKTVAAPILLFEPYVIIGL